MKCGDEKFASKTSGSSAVPNISLRTIIKNLLLAVNMILLGMQFLLFFLGRWIMKNGVRGPREQMFVTVKDIDYQLLTHWKNIIFLT